MKVLHIINSLRKGGAEGNLYRLCVAQKKKYQNKIDITILTLIEYPSPAEKSKGPLSVGNVPSAAGIWI